MGAEFTGTGAPTATLPGTHATNDILVLVLQSSNETNTVPAGYQQLGPQNGIGTNAAAGATKMLICWKRDGGSESAPTITDSGDHTYGFMFAVRGCPTTGDPFHFLGGSYKFTASTAFVGPKGITNIDNCLITDIAAQAVDNASGQLSGSATNSDLSSVTTQFNDGTTDGTGGGLTMISGIKSEAGPIGATTWTWSNSTADLCSRIAWIPADTFERSASSRTPEVQVFLGSPLDANDTWVKPTGARLVFVSAVGGGASGSAGRNAATAAGGGGGGGGMYAERWLNADDLAATVTVHAGKGGAATANSDGAASNVGIASTFQSSSLLNANPGQAATASATGAGGAGGAGGGTSSALTPSAGAFANFFGSQPATGGTGGTTAAAGSQANDDGGGGGAGGGTSQSASAGGTAKKGGGGGGGGRSNTNVGTGGVGGSGAAGGASAGAAGTDSTNLPYGGGGGAAGTSAAGPGGVGGFPGGGGGGGGSQSGAQRGERGGHGCVVVETHF